MLVHKKNAPIRKLEHLELWNSFSDNVCVYEFRFIREARVKVYLPDGRFHFGNYSQTIDWIDSPSADNPGSIGHKNAHLIKLDEGTYCLQPNNRIYWYEPAFVTKPFKKRPNYVTNEQIFNVENIGWQSEDSDKMFYGVKSIDKTKQKTIIIPDVEPWIESKQECKKERRIKKRLKGH